MFSLVFSLCALAEAALRPESAVQGEGERGGMGGERGRDGSGRACGGGHRKKQIGRCEHQLIMPLFSLFGGLSLV